MAFWPGRSCVHFAAVLCLWAGLPTSKHTQSRWWGGGEAHGVLCRSSFPASAAGAAATADATAGRAGGATTAAERRTPRSSCASCDRVGSGRDGEGMLLPAGLPAPVLLHPQQKK